MKRTIIWIVSLCAVTSAAAQEISDTTWTGKGVAGLNLSQVSLSNWAAGGDGSVAFDVLLNYDLVYRRERHLWQNRLELAYGLNNTSSNGMRKTNDKIYLSSVYGYRIARAWYASALLNFNTQFANGYDYNSDPRDYISRFMAPGYLMIGAGVTAFYMSRLFFMTFHGKARWTTGHMARNVRHQFAAVGRGGLRRRSRQKAAVRVRRQSEAGIQLRVPAEHDALFAGRFLLELSRQAAERRRTLGYADQHEDQ